MRLILNGEVRDAPDLPTLAHLATWLRLPDFGSAIELNGQVIRRAHQGVTPLHDGDRLEIVRLVGGG